MQTQIKLIDPVRAKAFFQDKLDFTLGPVELDHLIKDGASIVVVDVREAEDFDAGHVPGAVNLPKDKWNTLNGLAKDKVNILYCYTQQCHLAAAAAVYFAERGYAVKEVEGGFAAWEESDLDTEQEHSQPLKNIADKLLHKRQ